MKIRSNRFAKKANKLLEEFNSSLVFDKKLYKEDINGSIIHCDMLEKQNIISKEDANNIKKGLNIILEEMQNAEFSFNIEDEDIHMAIEKRLIELVGDSGKKLHTARSRNDQVALDFRLYVLAKNKNIIGLLKDLMKVLLEIAKKHKNTIMPGKTHLQNAQVISLSFHLLAYVSMFTRDLQRFEDSYNRNDISPLGSAALAGTAHNIDRQYTARMLGFKAVSINALDSVSDRDFALEILFNISTTFVHISRIAEELILWSSGEFKFIALSDEYSTGSSIMPQKKNPDIPELLRAKTGRVNGNLISLLTVMKALPLAYNKDMQEDKESVFDSVENIEISLKILKEFLLSITINKENMYKACQKGHLIATDLADYLVSNCSIPFREAYQIIGEAVKKAEDIGLDLSMVDYKFLKDIDQRVGEDVQEYLSIKNSLNSKNSEGACSIARVEEQIKFFEEFLK